MTKTKKALLYAVAAMSYLILVWVPGLKALFQAMGPDLQEWLRTILFALGSIPFCWLLIKSYRETEAYQRINRDDGE
jgi:hypothetical protein